jgi:RNA polymerase-binding transcription factor DksA
MNTNPELTPEVLAELRAALEAKRERLRSAIAGLRVSEDAVPYPLVDPLSEPEGDRGDSSVELEEWDEDHQEELNEEVELAEVEHALAKFTDGTYGICEDCGRPIPLARLRILPEARYDVQHERFVETHEGEP